VQSFITSYCLSCFLLSSTKYCLFNAVVITPASCLFSSSHALSTVSNIIFNLHLDRYLLFLYSSAIQHTCMRHLHQRKDFVFIIINRKSNSSFFFEWSMTFIWLVSNSRKQFIGSRPVDVTWSIVINEKESCCTRFLFLFFLLLMLITPWSTGMNDIIYVSQVDITRLYWYSFLDDCVSEFNDKEWLTEIGVLNFGFVFVFLIVFFFENHISFFFR